MATRAAGGFCIPGREDACSSDVDACSQARCDEQLAACLAGDQAESVSADPTRSDHPAEVANQSKSSTDCRDWSGASSKTKPRHEPAKGTRSRPGKVRDLAAVWRDTRKHLKRLCKEPAPVFVHDFEPSFHLDPDAKGVHDASYHCRVALSAEDVLQAAVRVSVGAGERALVLNFASKNIPGGAVASGVLAQEETIYRRTSLAMFLDPEKPPRCYPLPPGRCIVSQQVAVVKSIEYEWLALPFPEIDIVSSAAEQKPAIAGDGLRYANAEEMTQRAQAVLQAAMRVGSRNLVLGAWGCGGFRNPPYGLAEIFRELLFDKGYGACFDYVEFAVPAEKHAQHFRAVFGKAFTAPLGLE